MRGRPALLAAAGALSVCVLAAAGCDDDGAGAAALPDAGVGAFVDGGFGEGGEGCGCELGPCIRREKDPEEGVCAPRCDRERRCPVGYVCLGFPSGPRCLKAGALGNGMTCNSPDECAGGLCIWSGGGPAHCSSQCDGPNDLSCGEGQSCLPSLSRDGSYACYTTGTLAIGESCSGREAACEGGYCLGVGFDAYCTEFCRPRDAVATCPGGWGCAGHEQGHLCCWAERSGPGGCPQ